VRFTEEERGKESSSEKPRAVMHQACFVTHPPWLHGAQEKSLALKEKVKSEVAAGEGRAFFSHMRKQRKALTGC